MTAKQQAIHDIQQELKSCGKCFLAFREELNPIMDSLVANQLKQQSHVH